MGERCPVQTSAVYVLGRASQFAAVPPPSPPSPATGNSRDLCAPIEELSLDASTNATSSAAADLPSGPSALTSVPDSPELSPCMLSPTYSSCSLASSAGSPVVADATTTSLTSSVASLATIAASTSEEASASVSSTPTSPVLPATTSTSSSRLAGAVHVLATEAAALQAVARLYATSQDAREAFDQAVEAIKRTQQTAHSHNPSPGKLVVVGVGKSGHIGRKLVATFNSLAIPASFLHPTEALHGDLGHIRAHDALLFITYSGKSHELVSLLPHIDAALPLIVLTGHVDRETCELVQRRRHSKAPGATILLPAPIPVEEKVSFGVAAPTASTTTALAVGDALAIVTSKELHPSTESVFRRNHPGGAIGQAFQSQNSSSSSSSLSSMASVPSVPSVDTIRHRAVLWKDIPIVKNTTCADVLRAGYSSANGWVRVVSGNNADNAEEEYVAPPSRIRGLCSADLVRPVHEVGRRLVVSRADVVAVAADTTLSKAVAQLTATVTASADVASDTVVAVMEHGEIIGVLELQELLRAEA